MVLPKVRGIILVERILYKKYHILCINKAKKQLYNHKQNNMSTDNSNNCTGISNTCANCGKEGSEVTNTCNKCKMVMYCNAACKKKHRSKHKKACDRRVAELHDIELFKQPPPLDDCPICFLRMPCLTSVQVYMSCCGKLICRGCTLAPLYDNRGNKVNNEKCAFCRTPNPTSEREMIERYEF